LGFIKNKPFYDTRQDLVITWDGVVEDKETFNNGTLVKVSDEILSKETLEKGTIYIGNGTGEYEISQCNGFVVELEDMPVFSVSPSSGDWVVCIYEDFDLAGTHYTKGVYFKTMGEGVAWVEKLLIPNTTGELKTLDEKYLPSPFFDCYYDATTDTEDNYLYKTNAIGDESQRLTVDEYANAVKSGKLLRLHVTQDGLTGYMIPFVYYTGEFNNVALNLNGELRILYPAE